MPLLPGTHHLKFIVDGQWRVADSYPTAVDDEGSLANYIAVPQSGFTPPSSHKTSPPPTRPPFHPPMIQPGQSFWSTSSSNGVEEGESPSQIIKHTKKGPPPKWTSEFPAELIAAAREEENYLASSSSASDSQSTLGIAAPNIPPAPVLPRHLDKLILNVRKDEAKTGGRTAAREKEREERRTGRKGRSTLGMTSTTMGEDGGVRSQGIPVITPNGTDIGQRSQHNSSPTRAAPRSGHSLDTGPGLSDDASVLPVPSHVVLHHLSTSAIRNGVLAVGNTTRYRKKVFNLLVYMTIISDVAPPST